MSTDPLIGKKLGDYIIVDTLGHGGMARVYRGIDKKLNRYAAVKVIDAHLISDHEQEEYRQRFQNEARAIARLNHPNIVGIYQFDQVGTIYYMAMSFIEGRDLRSILRDYAKNNTFMPYSQVLKIIQDIGAALDYAHKEGVIHRDIKPSNIMVTPSGRGVLTDFGLALSVSEGTVGNTFGSAHYIAPEQAVSSAQAVPQSDIYSLGVVLFEMLTSRVPFQDQNAMAVAMKHLNDPPPSPSRFNPNITPKVDQMVLRALNKTPNKRYPTSTAMAQALESALALGDGDVDEANSVVQELPSWTGGSPSSPSRPSIGSTGSKDTLIFNTPEGTRPRPPLDDLPTVTDSRKSHATRAALIKQQADQAQRMRLFGVGGVVLIIGALLLLLLALFNNNDSGANIDLTETADIIALAGTQTAAAASVVTEEPTATDTPTEEATAEASPTPEPTTAPTDTTAPTVPPVPTDTREPAASDTPTDEPTNTAAPTDTNEPTATIEEAPVSLLGNASAAPVLLIYDANSLFLLNQSGDNADVSGLSFVQVDSSGREMEFEGRLWNGGSRPTTALPNETCFQVYKNTAADVPEPPDACRARHSFRAVSSPRWFWISATSEATFEVRREGEVLATCEIAAGECALDVSR